MQEQTSRVYECLQDFNVAHFNHNQAYNSFLRLAQQGNFEEAAKSALAASAMLESAMDAFLSACRFRDEASKQS